MTFLNFFNCLQIAFCLILSSYLLDTVCFSQTKDPLQYACQRQVKNMGFWRHWKPLIKMYMLQRPHFFNACSLKCFLEEEVKSERFMLLDFTFAWYYKFFFTVTKIPFPPLCGSLSVGLHLTEMTEIVSQGAQALYLVVVFPDFCLQLHKQALLLFSSSLSPNRL